MHHSDLQYFVQVRIKVVYSGIGPVTSSDVALASAAEASILAFNVKPAAPAVEALAKQCAVVTCTQVRISAQPSFLVPDS